MEGADVAAEGPEPTTDAAADHAPPEGEEASPPALSRKSSVGKCQVAGCAADLSTAKSYMRRYRVCEVHMKMPQVRRSTGVTLWRAVALSNRSSLTERRTPVASPQRSAPRGQRASASSHRDAVARLP